MGTIRNVIVRKPENNENKANVKVSIDDNYYFARLRVLIFQCTCYGFWHFTSRDFPPGISVPRFPDSPFKNRMPHYHFTPIHCFGEPGFALAVPTSTASVECLASTWAVNTERRIDWSEQLRMWSAANDWQPQGARLLGPPAPCKQRNSWQHKPAFNTLQSHPNTKRNGHKNSLPSDPLTLNVYILFYKDCLRYCNILFID